MDTWTAICREITGNNLLAVGFTNGKNKRIRVPIEQLQMFMSNNRISNITFNPIKFNIESSIVNIQALETYRYSPTGRCTYVPGLSEYEVLRLSGIDESDDIVDKVQNVDDKVDKIKLKSKLAIAIGVIGVTTAGIKAINKSINNISTKEIKIIIYQKLNKYGKLLDIIIQAKNNTNKLISSNRNIKEYSRDLECIGISYASIKQDILQYGVLTYTRNIQQIIQVCLEPIIKYNLMDESLREFGVEATFRVYSSALRNKIYKIRKLHYITQTLLEENKGKVEELPSDNIAINQQELINNIENKLAELELSISKHEDSEYTIDMLRTQLSKIIDEEKRNEYYDYLYNLQSIGISKDSDNIHKKNIIKQLENISKLVDSIGFSNFDAKESVGIKQYLLEEIKMIEQEVEINHFDDAIDIRNTINYLRDKLKINEEDNDA